jgi:hypothetical protein
MEQMIIPNKDWEMIKMRMKGRRQKISWIDPRPPARIGLASVG